MMYAVIPRRNSDSIPWIFQIPLDTWLIERIEDNGAVQCYIALKGDNFNQQQMNVLNNNSGIIFETDETFISWHTANGTIQLDTF